jgi:hypothetical protein
MENRGLWPSRPTHGDSDASQRSGNSETDIDCDDRRRGRVCRLPERIRVASLLLHCPLGAKNILPATHHAGKETRQKMVAARDERLPPSPLTLRGGARAEGHARRRGRGEGQVRRSRRIAEGAFDR